MGFQLQICSISRFSWSILVKCCVHLQRSSIKTLRLLLKKKIFHKYWLFCYRFLTFTFDFVAYSIFFLSVIPNNSKKKRNYSVVQSAFMTGFRTDFTSSVWNFCRWLADRPPRETSRRWGARRNSCFGRLYFYLSVRYKLVINEPLQGETCHPATVIWRTLGRYGTNTGHGSKIYLDVFSVSILHRHPTGISI